MASAAQTILRDRDIVELALPPRIVSDLVRNIYQHDGDDRETAQMCHEVIGHLTVDMHEPLRQRPYQAAKIQRRIEHAAEAVGDAAEGRHFSSVILATRLLIQQLIGEEWIVMHADGAFDLAWERLSAAIEEHAEKGALDNPEWRGEADRIAREMRRRLSEQGLYASSRQTAEVAG